jgi:L-alanine-DL-glutamate epimerase-like enolase superfamily enzyme
LKIKLTHIGGFQKALQVAAVMGAKGLPVVVGQGSACTPLLSAAETHLHASLPNAQPGGEMTGFLRLGNQNIFSGIEVTHGKAVLTDAAGLGIEVNQKRLAQAAIAIN